MKSLAAFAMRGRLQALLIAVAASGSILFCWISAAVVALVTLRKGAGHGLWLLMWAALPALAVMLVTGDSSSVMLLACTLILAVVLRYTVSLPMALLAAAGVALISSAGLMLFASEILAQIATVLDGWFATMESQLSANGEEVKLPRPSTVQVAGMMGTSSAVTAIACLLLARYWQAALYNPGGFGREFRALRFSPLACSSLVLASLLVVSYDNLLGSWAMAFIAPLLFAGLALVHATVHHKSLNSGWLIGFYLALLLIGSTRLIVVGIAIADSWLDLRRRWRITEGDDSAQ